jgi:hypothetical protein
MCNCIGYDDRDLFGKIKKGKFDLPSHLSNGAKELIAKILKVNPDERPSVDEVRIFRLVNW